MLRKFLFQPRRRHELGGIHFEHSLAHQELKKRAQGGELAGYRSFLFLSGVECCQPITDGDVIDLGNRRLGSLPCFWICGREVIVKLFEVALIIAKGVLAEVALVTQVFEKLG